jgi:putative ABC transport system permease protein
MGAPGGGARRGASSFWKTSVPDEVDAELQFHVEMRARELMAGGVSAEVARAAAIAKFGDMRQVNATCRNIAHHRERDMRRTEYLSELAHDARFAVRQLLKAPGFTITAALTLALGIGATTAIFSAVEAVVLRPFPFPNTRRLTFVNERWREQDGNVSVGNFTDWQRRSTSFAQLAAANFRSVSVSRGESPDRVLGAEVTANWFPAYGMQPELGRVFSAAEDAFAGAKVVVLSDGLWHRSFAGDPGTVGRSIVLDGVPYQVIGVMPPSFDPTDSHEQLWMPLAFSPTQRAEHDEHYLTVVGLLRPGVSIGTAQRDMDAVARRLSDEFPKDNKGRGAHVQPLSAAIIGDYGSRLYVLLGAVACVLMIACGNTANLLLARGAARGKELAVRAAIGAGRARIFRQLITESFVLAFLSAAVGVCIAWWGIRVLVRAAPSTIPRIATTHIDGLVLLFALGTATASAFLFGLIPALRSARGDIHSPLRDGGRTSAASARDTVRGVLIAAEAAMALTLLVGAGLLVRSAINMSHVDPGFDMHGLLVARVALPPDASADSSTGAERIFDDVLRAVRAQPGVRTAALTSAAPLFGSGTNGLVPEGRPLELASVIDSRLRVVSPGYLAAMRIPLVAGRGIGTEDVRGGARVMVVSAALAKAGWPHESAVGKRVACCEGGPDHPDYKTIIGVAADVRTDGPAGSVRPEFYLPMTQAPPAAWTWIGRTMTIVARAANGDAASLTPGIRAAVRSVSPDLPVFSVATMNDRLGSVLEESRFNLTLLATLGVVALLLSAAGIYSVVSYFVVLRAPEIGIRIALGATTRNVVLLMTWQGLRPVLVGLAAGCVAATWLTRLLRGSLVGVSAADPMTFVAVALGLLAVAFIATLVPARQASAIDPAQALHG